MMKGSRFGGRMPRLLATSATLALVWLLAGCQRSEFPVPTAGPLVQNESPAPATLSTAQQAAIDAIAATGGEIESDRNGFPLRIDLASDRVSADEEVLRAVLNFPDLVGLRLAVHSLPPTALADLAQFHRLEEFYLQDASIADGDLAELLHGMPQLRRLTLRRLNSISDTGIATLPGCESLEVVALIEMNNLSGAGLQTLAACPHLRALDLRQCGRLGAEDFPRLAELKGLTELKLGGPAVNDDLADTIISLPKLQSLSIEDAQVSGVFLERLAADDSLAARFRTVEFARCLGLTDEALPQLARFSNLETVVLRDLPLTGAFLQSMHEAHKEPLPWKTLVMTNAFLADNVLTSLSDLAPNLQRLDLRGSLTDSAAAKQTLTSLKNLQELKLE